MAMLELARIDSGRYDILDDKIDLAVVERASRGTGPIRNALRGSIWQYREAKRPSGNNRQ